MTWITLFALSLAACLQVHAAEPKTAVTTRATSEGRRPPWVASVRIGPSLNPLDNEVEGDWEHDYTSSLGVTVGVYYTVPRAWREIYFFFGPDVAYLTSTETYGNAKIESSLLQLSALGGVAYKPHWLGGQLAGSLPRVLNLSTIGNLKSPLPDLAKISMSMITVGTHIWRCGGCFMKSHPNGDHFYLLKHAWEMVTASANLTSG